MPSSAKSIFITGAGSGMGREGAKLFHANGWRVGAIDRNEAGLASLTQELGTDRLWTRQVDVTDKAALDAALADFCADNVHGGLDMLWNNAGIANPAGSKMFRTRPRYGWSTSTSRPC